MGLDIYAGTLTRYYSHNWKTVVQQWAEENGYEYDRVIPNDDKQGRQPSPNEIRRIVTGWSSQLVTTMSKNYKREFKAWQEDHDATPYYTDKPDWDAFMALVLYTCGKIYNEPIPESLENHFDPSAFPILQRAVKDKDVSMSLLKNAVCWVPIDETIFISGPMPTDVNSIIGTVKGLRSELLAINDFEWKADEETILSWNKTEGYNTENPEAGNNTVSMAKFAFSILWRAVKFSKKNNVPIVLDF